MPYPEADLSRALAEWLAYRHPHDNPKGLFSFMIPNERGSGTTQQRKVAAGQLKLMGLRPGVADWCFVWRIPAGSAQTESAVVTLYSSHRVGFIELKATGKKRDGSPRFVQTEKQAAFQQQAEAFGLRYAVCRSLEECVETLKGWGAT